MAFRYPAEPHVRRHGPGGYADYERFRPWLRDEFAFRCVYCLVREEWGRARGVFELDHFEPVASDPKQGLAYDNLVYACRSCNSAKASSNVPDPCQVLIQSVVTILPDGRIIATSGEAQRLIRVLALDSAESTEFRRLWIDIAALAQRYDPELFDRLMRYPDDLPDLARLRPPEGNNRPAGIEQSCLARRNRGELTATY